MSLVMRGASRESLAVARERLNTLLSSDVGVNGVELAEQLFTVVDLLDAQPALRAALTDPARNTDAKASLITSLLQGKVSGSTVDLLAGLARARWSAVRDLADAIDVLAVQAAATSAQQRGVIDSVEDDVFRFGQIVSGDTALRAALSDRAASPDAKAALVSALLAGKATDESSTLLTRVISHPRGRSLENAVASLQGEVAERRSRITAKVVAATVLTEQQRERLATALARQLRSSSTVHLNVVIDPDVVGGIKVTVGDDVVDATLANRLEEARRRLAG